MQEGFQDEFMSQIDYDQVTISLNDYFEDTENSSQWIRFYGNKKLKLPLRFYVSLRTDLMKCFSVDLPFSEGNLIEAFGFSLKRSIFPDDERPSYPQHSPENLKEFKGLYISMHYPRQTLLVSNHWNTEWEPKNNSINKFYMSFDVSSQTVVSKRNTPKKRCFKEWENADQIVMDSVVRKMGCRPPFWKTTSNSNICSNSSLKAFSLNSIFDAAWSLRTPPCKFIEQLAIAYQESDEPSGKTLNVDDFLFKK